MKPLLSLTLFGIATVLLADERTVTPEQLAAIANEGETHPSSRPAKLPDLTRGEPIPDGKHGPPRPWNLGPTGIIGILVGGHGGDQIQVQATLKGSPAEGKFQKGDVLLGMNGTRFVAGEHLGQRIGKAIIEAEREENGGQLSFQVWRDTNLIARSGRKDIAGVDIEQIFAEARDDNSLYDWKPEAARAREAQGFDDHPIAPTNFEVNLTLRVLPPYSDTAPYNCPKTARILEEAWKVLEQKFIADPNKPRSGRGGVLEAFALVASGKPEHRELVRQWVRGKHSPWRPPTEPIGAMFEPGYKGYKGYQSWHKGFNGLYCALYYEATGDDYVLPALRKYAIETAMGQSGGGSWGHTFAYPSFNGGKFHYMNPGYGALNCAGNRCFFLVTLAQKLGIEHPEIDAAVVRARRYFGSYIDQGAIPYGEFAAAGTDDSNGKNTGVAFSLKLLGDTYGAKYFAMMSSHCSFTRRGGHGHDYHGNWSSWAASLCGPEVRMMGERNLRWRRTLCRLHDGSFVYQSPGEHKTLRNPTATEVLHQAVYLKQTLITGKDPDESIYPNERELGQLLASARPQLNDTALIERAGTPWQERGTDEIFDLLDIFMPKARGKFAAELGARYQAGETEIAPRLAKLLESDNARFREAACRGLLACGQEAALAYQSKIIGLLDAPEAFVRISALKTLDQITQSPESKQALLQATAKDFDQMAAAPNSFRNYAQSALFKADDPLANAPFEAGYDEELVQRALEKLIELDPMGNRPFLSTRKGVWTKDTVTRLAGPLIFAVEKRQVNDQMFPGRRAAALSVLAPFGFRETTEATAETLWERDALPRRVRSRVTFKRGLVDIDEIKKHPGAFKSIVAPLKNWIADDPLAKISVKVGKTLVETDVEEVISLIEAAPPVTGQPSLARDVEQWLLAHLPKDRVAACRTVLEDPTRKITFRQMAALSQLAVEEDGLADLLRFVGHPNRRLRTHTHHLIRNLSGSAVTPALGQALQSGEPENAVGLLTVLRERDDAAALPFAREALTHPDASVRAEAIQTVFALGGDAALVDVFQHMRSAADPTDLAGCEHALLSRTDDPAHAGRTIDACIALLPTSEEPLRDSLHWVLARLGGPKALAVLDQAAQSAESDEALDRIVEALSFAPDAEAGAILVRLMRSYPERAARIAAVSTRRMVIGPDGVGTLSDTAKMDFAEPVLKMVLDEKLITYLGRVRTGRSILALRDAMKRGALDHATLSIITAAEGMAKAPAADREFAADALRDVIEYIEVTQLRGGPEAHDWREYPRWKTTSERAGRALLKVFQPEKAPLPEFDDLDLDF